ncbi:AGAP005698-PA-like protein [Anopheles sinensis]|uniref:AGAP005698-PA-like protein n=1 Tax=Anopheles sinensis TaxID=74873 RepID=A0A084W4C5_ANOSI|nr:AGAP005698-PA-like protein [Anopheles sinensis]
MAIRPYGVFLGACVLLLLAGLRSTTANFVGGDQNQVVQFGTYDVMLQECFFQKIYATMPSPQTVAFNNPAAKAIAFISVETDQGLDLGGITASITSGTIGTSTSMTLQVATSPVSTQFLNSGIVRMFCKK